jgi:cytochrome bd-type quinol oxidase subunit 1
MNYPVWELYYAGGGLLIAFIAVVHVYVAHFAVGGGLFLVLTEMKAYREQSHEILVYTKRHTKFFLLLTMVFGGITGVGIWFTISLLSPGATSTLIHLFVFGFATEWVCFLAEIIALFIYYYQFEKMKPSSHLVIGWLYFMFAWLSLFLINGIIDFMLTPGDWLTSNSFWDAFFNPSMLPALVFRTFLAVFLAGVFGFITASLKKENGQKQNLIRYCSKWLIIPLPLMFLAGLWYLNVLPAEVREMILRHSPEILPAVKLFIILLPAFLIIGLLMWVRMPSPGRTALAFFSLLLGLVYMGSFEWVREAGRRPYLIYHHTYSNAVTVENENEINRNGVLRTAKWVKNKALTDDNLMDAGKEIFRLECTVCHSVGGPMKDILPLTSKFTVFGMDAQLNGQGKLLQYMPTFFGTEKERFALATYIVEGLHGKKEPEISFAAMDIPISIPAFDEDSEYVLLAWSSAGMVTLSDNDSFLSLGPPGIEIFAQLIRRGETPEIVTDEVEITYAVETDFAKPSRYVKFWEVSEKLVGKKISPDKGLTGNGVTGKLTFRDDLMAYTADQIPVVPYATSGQVNPYPLFTIEARAPSTGEVLAVTQTAATVSTELGCKNCHGGKWRVGNQAGISDDTARDVLYVHDRINKTRLSEEARAGRPVMCVSCHQGPNSKLKGDPDRMNFSAAIHGFHAVYLADKGSEACYACHPASSSSHTQAFRGIHKAIELNCTNCHLSMEDHTLSLLMSEQAAGKASAQKLMKHLTPAAVDAIEAVKPRSPWTNQPDCLSCHVDFSPPDTDEAGYDTWTRESDQLFHLRTDDAGIMCMACHGTSHALYPAHNRFGLDRNNIQPLQYQQTPYPIGANMQCAVCHTIDMEDEIHHPNMLTEFRNTIP